MNWTPGIVTADQGFMVPSSTLLLASVGSGSLAMPDQIGAPAVRATVPEESVRLAQSHLERGEALSETRDYTAAIDAYSSAIRLNPNLAEAFNDRAFAHYLRGDAELAIADFTRAIELRPNVLRLIPSSLFSSGTPGLPSRSCESNEVVVHEV